MRNTFTNGLSVLVLAVAVVALLWAIRADNHAKHAQATANYAVQQATAAKQKAQQAVNTAGQKATPNTSTGNAAGSVPAAGASGTTSTAPNGSGQ